MIPAERRFEEAAAALRRCDLASLHEACESFARFRAEPEVGSRALAGWAEARARLARQKLMRGEPWESEAKGALQLAETAVRQDPACPEAHRSLSAALAEFPEQAERRRAASVRAVELGPRDASNWHERWKAFGSHLDDGAIRRALELEPDHFASVHDLGVAFSEAGCHEQAAALLEKAVSLNPESVQARYNLAVVLDRAGRAEEGEFVLREAATLHPDDALVARFDLPERRSHEH